MSAITVSEAAALLGISRRMMYSLAAPIGPVPCHRFGPAYLRRRARPQRCHLGGALNPAPPACEGVRRGTQGFRPAASAAHASATTRGTATGWPVERLIPVR